MTDRPLAGKVALVTGAGSGLGRATAEAFADAGACVACFDLKEEAVHETEEELNGRGGTAMAVAVDVSDEHAVQNAVAQVEQRFGRLDYAVNAAGVDFVTPVDEMTIQQWDTVLGVNLRGPFLIAKASLPVMRRQGEGHIVNVASTAAVRAWGNAAAYHASKWGLVGFSRALGVEGREYGVRVTTVIPGGMKTHWFDRFPEQGIPLPDEANLQDPANVARTIVFAVQMPKDSSLQELILTPINETSWP